MPNNSVGLILFIYSITSFDSCVCIVNLVYSFLFTVNYGQKGIDVFRELAEGNKICIAEEENIAFDADNEAYDEVFFGVLRRAILILSFFVLL